jgi:KDO2-lipid IV(A) lauroyltransferase
MSKGNDNEGLGCGQRIQKNLITGFLSLFALLPLCVLHFIGSVLSFFVRAIGYRRKVIRKNITECFPEMSVRERRHIENKFYRHLCDVMMESVKLFHISDAEMRRRVTVNGVEALNSEIADGKSIAIMLGHYGNWEWVQEIGRYISSDAICGMVYRPMHSNVWDRVFLQMRSRWGFLPIPQKKVVRELIGMSMRKQSWAIGFIADQRPNSASLNHWTYFMNHDTAYSPGAEEISKRVDAAFFYLDIARPRRGHYTFTFVPIEPDKDDKDPYAYTRKFLEMFEQTVRRDPSMWLWSHNRWKFGREKSSGEVKKS